MAKDTRTAPPQRKEPGFIGRCFGFLVATFFWVIASLIISILVEWVGIAFFWQEQGSQHAYRVLLHDLGYLNERVTASVNVWVVSIYETVHDLNTWTEKHIRFDTCLLYTSPSPRDLSTSRMPSSA